MTTELKEQLDKLTGETFRWEGQMYQFKNHRESAGKIVIETDKRVFVNYPNELEKFLQDITLVENFSTFKPNLPVLETAPKAKNDTVATVPEKIDLAIYKPTDTQKRLQTALLDSLKLVMADAKHIPQAKSVCDIANTMVNIEKNQIALMNTAKRKMNRS